MLSLDDSLVGKQIDGRFLITHYLGMGGMGTAYQAKQLDLSRDVCIKFLKKGALCDLESVARFRREARVLATLQHKNIVSCYAFGLFENLYPYLAMEYVEGHSLKKLANGEAFDWPRACNIVQEVCIALNYAHKNGFVHRDIKPENIMVTICGGEDLVKVVDFGLVGKQSGEVVPFDTLTDPGSIVGSVNYMAPEAFKGSVSDRSLDIYAVGCVLYELLSGQLPFDADNSIAVMYKHANERLPRLPANMAPDNVRNALEEIIWTATASDPSVRFQSCEEMSTLLACALKETCSHGDDSTASSQFGNLQSASRRSFLAVAATSLCLVILLLVFSRSFLRGGLLKEESLPNAIVSQTQGSNRAVGPMRSAAHLPKSVSESIKALGSLSKSLNELRNMWSVSAKGSSSIRLEEATRNYFESLQQFLRKDASRLTIEANSKVETVVRDMCKELTQMSAFLPENSPFTLKLIELQCDLLTSFGFYDGTQAILNTGKPVPLSLALRRGDLNDLGRLHENIMMNVNGGKGTAETLRYGLERLRPALRLYPLFRDDGKKFCMFVSRFGGGEEWSPSLVEIASRVKTGSRPQTVELLLDLVDKEIASGELDSARALLARIQSASVACPEIPVERLAQQLNAVGDFNGSLSVLDHALSTANRRGDNLMWCQVQEARVDLLLDCHKTAEAKVVLAEISGGPQWKAVETGMNRARSFDAFRALGTLNFRVGDYAHAAKFYRRASELAFKDLIIKKQMESFIELYAESLWNCNCRKEATEKIDADIRQAELSADRCITAEKLIVWGRWYGRVDQYSKGVELISRAITVLTDARSKTCYNAGLGQTIESLFHQANVALGHMTETKGDSAEALAIYRRLLKDDFAKSGFASGEHFDTLFAAARLFRQAGEKDQSLQMLHQIVDILRLQGGWSSADVSTFATAIREICEIELSFRGGNELRKYLREKRQSFAGVNPLAESWLLLCLADVALAEDDPALARECVSLATPAISESATLDRVRRLFRWNLRQKLVAVEIQLGNRNKADRICEQLVAEALDDGRDLEAVDMLCGRSDIAYQANELERATEFLAKASTLKTTRAAKIDRINMRLASILIAQGRKEDARKLWQETYSQYSVAPESQRKALLGGLEVAYQSLGLARTVEEANLHLRNALDLLENPTPWALVNLYYELSINSEKSGNSTQAREYLETATRSLRDCKYRRVWGPRFCQSCEDVCTCRLGSLFRRQGDLHRAREAFRKSVIGPRPQCWRLVELAEIEGELGNRHECEESYKRALATLEKLEEQPERLKGLVYLSYACWLYDTGKLSRAREMATLAEDLCGVFIEPEQRGSMVRNLRRVARWYKKGNSKFEKLTAVLQDRKE